MEQFEAMLGLLNDFQTKVLDEWSERTKDIPNLLSDKLLVMKDKLLYENFDKKV